MQFGVLLDWTDPIKNEFKIVKEMNDRVVRRVRTVPCTVLVRVL